MCVCVWTIATTVAPAFVRRRWISSKSPPGSTTMAFLDCGSRTIEQLQPSGPVGKVSMCTPRFYHGNAAVRGRLWRSLHEVFLHAADVERHRQGGPVDLR